MEGLNPAHPPAGTALCDLADIADPGSRAFHFREGEMLFAGFVVRVGEAVYGYVDSCPHAGWPMGGLDGRHLTREGELILCGAHGARFRREDGVCVAGPCVGQALRRWAIAVRQGRVVTL